MRLRHIATFLMVGALLAGAAPDPVTAQEKRVLSFIDVTEMPLISDPQVSPDGKQSPVRHGQAGLEGQPAHRPHLPDQRRRHRSGPVDVWRARRIDCRAGRRTARRSRSRLAATPTPTIRSTCWTSTAARRAASPIIPPRRRDLTWAPDGTAICFASTDAKSAEEREKDRSPGRRLYVRGERTSSSVTSGRPISTARRNGSPRAADFSVTAYELSNDGKQLTIRARAVAAARVLPPRGSVGERCRRQRTRGS